MFVQFHSLKLTDCLKTTYLNWVPCTLTYLMTLFNIFYGKKWIHMILLIIDVLISSLKLWCQKVHKKYSRPTFVDFLHFKTINPLFLISHRNMHLKNWLKDVSISLHTMLNLFTRKMSKIVKIPYLKNIMKGKSYKWSIRW